MFPAGRGGDVRPGGRPAQPACGPPAAVARHDGRVFVQRAPVPRRAAGRQLPRHLPDQLQRQRLQQLDPARHPAGALGVRRFDGHRRRHGSGHRVQLLGREPERRRPVRVQRADRCDPLPARPAGRGVRCRPARVGRDERHVCARRAATRAGRAATERVSGLLPDRERRRQLPKQKRDRRRHW